MGPSFLCSCAARQPQGEKGALLHKQTDVTYFSVIVQRT